MARVFSPSDAVERIHIYSQSLHFVFISACVHEVAVFAFSFDASNVACCQACYPEES